jgi:hypothetical protein
MIVCPVCEHSQEVAFECEVCGRDLSSLSGLGGLVPPPSRSAPAVELEVTRYDTQGDIPVPRPSGLETNSFEKMTASVSMGVDLELSHFSAVEAAPVERLADLTYDRSAPVGKPTPAVTGNLACRYCRHVQIQGAVCERCGMKLPRALRALAPEVPIEDWIRCTECGSKSPPGGRCRECGREMKSED